MKTYAKYTAEQLATMLRNEALTHRLNIKQLGRNDVTTEASAKSVAKIKAALAKR